MQILNTLKVILGSVGGLIGLAQLVKPFIFFLDWAGRGGTAWQLISETRKVVVKVLSMIDFAVIDFDYQYLSLNLLWIVLIFLSIYITFFAKPSTDPITYNNVPTTTYKHSGRIPSAFDNDPPQGYSNAERYSLYEAVSKALPFCEKYLNTTSRPQYKSPIKHLADQLKSRQDHIKQLYQQRLVRGEDKEILRNRNRLKLCFGKQFPEQESFNEEEIFSVVEAGLSHSKNQDILGNF